MKRTFSTVFLFISVVAVGAGLLFFPGAAVQGARKGLSFCGQILIPSIFPFMVLASFLVKSGLAKKIGRHIGAITRFLFYLPGCTGATILVGLIGGYPAGARGIKALVEQGEISPRQGERMLNFSVGAGPAFVITAVGANLLGNSAAGVVLFVSQVAAAVGIGVISGLIARRKGESADPPSSSRRQTTDKIDIATALVDSAADSTAGMLNMSAFVILFSALLAILEQSGAGRCFAGAYFLRPRLGGGLRSFSNFRFAQRRPFFPRELHPDATVARLVGGRYFLGIFRPRPRSCRRGFRVLFLFFASRVCFQPRGVLRFAGSLRRLFALAYFP